MSTGARCTMSTECEGDVVLSEGFVARSTIERLDLLQDWIGILQRAYDRELEAFRQEMVAHPGACPFKAGKPLWEALQK